MCEWFYRVGIWPTRYDTQKGTAVHSSTAVIAHGFWARVESIPWATSKSTNLPACVAARGV